MIGGTLSAEHTGTIPVVFTTFAVGEALALTSDSVHLGVDGEVVDLSQDNVTATWEGNTGRQWILGAHLDSVAKGPGINDNGTGVAVILEMARYVTRIQPNDTVTVSFWGAEEIGLVGSAAYVSELDEAELDQIAGYLNLDMVGSPNPGRFLYAGDQAIAEDAPGTEAIATALASWFDDQALHWQPTEVGGRSDHAYFVDRGVPSGGYFTGAEQAMSAAEAEIWGGSAGAAYDPCYHQECDTIDNVNLDALVEMAEATQTTLDLLLTESGESSQSTSRPSPWPTQQSGCQHEERSLR